MTGTLTAVTRGSPVGGRRLAVCPLAANTDRSSLSTRFPTYL
ncbi:MAG TPA: hypothetical protein VGS57_01220 [Thermoanaerobaculia bacterium]|jgi:hypothetical protein|nr:hypothetical protein [Thermoanaerobaculia bacterium]